LLLDLLRHRYGKELDPTAHSKKAAEWTAMASELGSQLDAAVAAGLDSTQAVEVYRVREILLSAHAVTEDPSVMARVIDGMWSDAARLGKASELCESAQVCADRPDDKKKQTAEEILEIEARLRTRCGCEVDDRPVSGRSPSADANDERTP